MIIKCRRGPKTLLHVGSGPKNPHLLPPVLRDPEWTEVRLDIDPNVKPDILGTITNMTAVADASMDGIFSSHNLEHIYSHEVPIALAEFRRVLRPQGFVMVAVPNLQAVAVHIAQGNLEDPLYVSGAGPITALDILYGLRTALAAGNHYMGHKTGFTAASLTRKFVEAGFSEANVEVHDLNLYGIGYKV